MNDFSVRVNGKKYILFESVSFTRSLDTLCGEFKLITTIKQGDYPIKAGNKIHVLINDKVVLTGWVFTISGQSSINGTTLTIAGRDLTADIVDSSVPDTAKNIEGEVTLKNLCEKVISGLGIDISVIDSTGGTQPFTEDDLEAGATGEGAFDFLESFARKRQVYLITSPEGNLVLFKSNEKQKATSSLIYRKNNHTNNLKNSSFTKSETSRFGKYVCKSQDNFGSSDFADYSGNGTNRDGIATDNAIRQTRVLEIVAEESMDDSDCTERAKEEANIRRSRGLEYTCTVAGAEQADGSLWRIGTFVKVNDEILGIKGIFLIRSISNTLDINTGTQTRIVCALPDAYTAQDSENETTKRKASLGDKF